MKEKLTPLVVTTIHKGVFVGYGIPSDAPIIKLANARMCLYWDAKTKGVVGLASLGAVTGTKLTPACKEIILRDVTAVMVATDEAAASWEKNKW